MGHLIPLLEGGLIFLTLEIFLFKPVWLVYVVLGLTLFIVLGMLVPKKRFLGGREFWHYLSGPLIFVWSSILLLLFFENIFFKHFFILGVAVYIFFYFENLFYYLVSGGKESSESFLRMTNMLGVVSIFFLAAGLYGVKTFIQLPIWLLNIIFFIFSAGLIYGSLWIIKQKFREVLWEVFIVALIISEFFLVIHFLPIGFYAGGAIVGVFYYIVAGILTNYLKNKQIPYKRYVITGLILLFVIVLTARWV
ncbi:hypothetical protein KJ885_01925 [Patescibacteria group bacterium]|nr:hypothetical protein [Patescibacteria group bacterium]